MKLTVFTKIDYFILFCVSILSFMGIIFIYSSGINSDGLLVSREYTKQIIWGGVGLASLVVVALFDYRRLKRYALWLYGAMILILIGTKFLGREVNGARSWIGIGFLGIQPAEIGKIIYILCLAWYLDRTPQEKPLKRFFVAFFIMCLPLGIILLQPDLGTASVYFPIFIIMCFMANVPLRYLAIVLGISCTTILFTVLPIWQSSIIHKTIPIISILTDNRLRFIAIFFTFILAMLSLVGLILFKQSPYYVLVCIFGTICFSLLLSLVAAKFLQTYQVQRLIVFIDPYSDPHGAGWNIIQSKIAIGSGGLWGRGFKQGTQSHYQFLPEQSTDFIFSILAEESGFVGGIIVFAAFLGILLRIIQIIRKTSNRFGSFIAAGVLGMYSFHFMVNVGMVMGVMPITGIPLPFLSYGGSAYITNMVAAGLVMSIYSRRLDFNDEVL